MINEKVCNCVGGDGEKVKVNLQGFKALSDIRPKGL